MKGWDRLTATQPLVISSVKKVQSTISKNASSSKSILSKISNQKVESIEDLDQDFDKKLLWSNLFDNMMESCLKMPQYLAFEKHMKSFFHSNRAIFWEKRQNANKYFSRTLKSEVPSSCPLIQQIINSNQPIIPSIRYDSDIILTFSLQSYDHQFFIPLKYPDGTIFAFFNLSRHQNCSPFGKEEIDIANYVQKKFNTYGSLFFQKERNIELASKVSQVGPLSQVVKRIKKCLSSSFQCEFPDIWYLQLSDDGYFRFDDQMQEFIGVYKCSVGAVGIALRGAFGNRLVTINSSQVSDLKNYTEQTDGEEDCPIIMGSCEFEGKVWCIALRGQRKVGPYTNSDQNRLSSIIPFIVRSLSFSGGFLRGNLDVQKKSELERIKKIDVISSIVASSNVVEIVKLVQEKVADLINVEFCRVLIVDENTHEFKCDFEQSLENCKKFPLNNGFAGFSLMNKQTVICQSPEDDQRFNRDVDVGQPNKIRNIISVPFINDQNSVTSVIVLSNKCDGEFNESDKLNLKTLVDIFGVALKNAESYCSSLRLLSNLNEFINSSKLNKKSPKQRVEEILQKIKDVTHCLSLNLFVVQPSNSALHEFISIREKIAEGTQYASSTIELGKTSTFSVGSDDRNVICCIPLFDSEDKIMGILEVLCNLSEFCGEINSLESFLTLASLFLDKSYLKEFCNYEECLNSIIGENNKDLFDTPNSLLTSYEANELFDVTFVVKQDTSELDLIKIVFKCFDQYNLKQEFRISNQKLYLFLTNLSQTYNDVPYHNWAHGVSTCVFSCILLMKSQLDEAFNKKEILSLFLASLGHDSGHDGFAWNESEEIPLSILFKKQSVMEINHCKNLISVLTKNSCSLLSEINEKDLDSVYELITYLILQTDMSKHFTIINDFVKLYKKSEFSLEEPNNRKLLLAILLKCADLSDSLKNFEYTENVSKYIFEEFYHQGIIEGTEGMKFTNDVHKKKFLDKENSIPGFFKFVILPLFDVISDYNKNLLFIKDFLVSNIDKLNEKYAHKDDQAKAETDQAKNETDQAKNETDQAKNETEQPKNETEQPKNETDQAKNETDQAKNETEQPKNETEQAKNETEQPKNKTEQPKNETDQVNK